MIEIIPEPITFNPYKHHFRFLNEKTKIWQKNDFDTVKSEIQTIGNNLLDLYLGELAVETICNECLHYFKLKKINTKAHFLEWLKPLEYKKKILSDESVWIIKLGTDTARYIHIHPAKNSKYSIRVRATTLKTVIAMKVILQSASKKITVHDVNEIRTNFLDLSPVKSIPPEKGIYKLWRFFNNE